MSDGFTYCAEHVLTSPATLLDYQVKIIVNYGVGTNSGENVYCNEHCRGDFEDVAFTDSSGTPLPHWRELYTEHGYALFWVRVPEIYDQTIIVVKYGNADATSGSNAESTFLFFDSFKGSVLDGTKWSGGLGSVSYTCNDVLQIISASDQWVENSSDTGSQIHSTWNPVENCKIVWKSKIHLEDAAEKGQCGIGVVDNSNKIVSVNLHTDPDSEKIASGCYGCIDTVTYDFNGGGNDDTRVFALQKIGPRYTLKHKLYGDGFWVNDISHICSTSPSKLAIVVGKQQGKDFCNYVEIEWVYIRNCADKEPIHGPWTDEEILFICFESKYNIKPEPSVDPANIRFYASMYPSGGDIDPSKPQISAIIGNEISRISRAERKNGTIRYAKQFVRNENDMEWGPLNVYFSNLTQYSPNTSVSFALTGTKSTIDVCVELSGVATVTASGHFSTSVDLRNEVKAGEQIFNSSDDTISKATKIKEVASTYIQLERAYIGTLGANKTLSVCPATMSQFVAPTSHTDELSPEITIGIMEYVGMWKRYEVFEECPPFSNDWFTIVYEEK